jgi:hypothetical protein
MRFIAALIGALLVALTTTPASPTVRVSNDLGGQIGPYLERLMALRDSGEPIVIDGNCLSACTLVLGVLPPERICVTPRARLGFHAAWHTGDFGRPVVGRAGTQLLMEIYPAPVKAWIRKQGGLSPQMIYLSGRELTSMYRACD